MKKIIYTNPDGILCVVHPTINTHTLVDGKVVPIPEDIAESAAIDRAVFKLPDFAKQSFQIVDESVIPKDRTFRNAWKEELGSVGHDMEKCRELHRQKLRELRAPLLEAADVEFMKALEAGQPTTAIVAKKQALRDVTRDPRISSASSVDELKAVIPEVLL